MNSFEKRFLLRNFFIFFTILELLLITILYFYYHTAFNNLKDRLFDKMYNCSWTLSCKEFQYTIIPKTKKEFSLYEKENQLIANFSIPQSKKFSLQIIYPNLHQLKKSLFWKNLIYFLILSLVIAVITLFISLYSLKPLKEAFRLNEEFVKDILHDLNTPLSSILLNLSLIEDRTAPHIITRIHNSIQRILSLQNNLKLFLKERHTLHFQKFDIKEIILPIIDTYKLLYPAINFELIEKKTFLVKSDKELLTRILDNLISNAAKYNSKKTPFVKIIVDHPYVTIIDNGKGIENIDRIWDRFYKEGDRGIGIGLHIVQKLSKELNIKLSISSKKTHGTKIELTFP